MPFFRIPEDQQNSIVALLDHKDRRALAISCHAGRRIVNGQYEHEEKTTREKVRLFSSHALRICKSPEEAQLCYRQTLDEVRSFLKFSSNFVRPAYKQLISDFFATFKPIEHSIQPQIHYPRQEFYQSIQPLLPTAEPLVDVDLESVAKEFDFIRLDLTDDDVGRKAHYEKLLKGLKEGSIDCETTQYGMSLILYALPRNMELIDLLLSLGANIECKTHPSNETPLRYTLQFFQYECHTETDREVGKDCLIKLLEKGANTEAIINFPGGNMTVEEGLRRTIEGFEEQNNAENQEDDLPPPLPQGGGGPVNYKTLQNDLKEIYQKYFVKTKQ